MRINLQCPFSEKDKAKALGAKWDAEKRCWYIVDVEDLTPFMRWIARKSESSSFCQEGLVNLTEYLKERYGRHAPSLSRLAAKEFGIPYPLKSGWIKEYAHRTAPRSVVFANSVKPPKISSKGKRVSTSNITTGIGFVEPQPSEVPPWEDEDPPELIRLVREIGLG